MKVLNLYAGIGGNRKLWENVEVTAVENNQEIADIYKHFFPQDKVVVADAHQYLLDHFKEFDFIWSSPPCPTHSRMNHLKVQQNMRPRFPDMKLYEEIVFLKHWFKGKWVVENVISYYEPLILPYKAGNHYFWSNFNIEPFADGKRGLRCVGKELQRLDFLQRNVGFDLSNLELGNRPKIQLLLNCVKPELGLHVFNCAFKRKQSTLESVT